jgi:hypothetical protein
MALISVLRVRLRLKSWEIDEDGNEGVRCGVKRGEIGHEMMEMIASDENLVYYKNNVYP